MSRTAGSAVDMELMGFQEPQDTTTETAPAPKKLSKAERRAQQAELNKKLWEEA